MKPFRIGSIAVGVWALTAALVAQNTAAPGSTLSEGAQLITGSGVAPITDSAVLIEGTRVAAVGRRGTVKAPAGTTVVDLRGKTIMPALVDAHSHLGYTDVRTGNTSSTSYTRDNLL